MILSLKAQKNHIGMFTSRAEYRLLLREDNADIRLSHYGVELGLLDRAYGDKIKDKKQNINEAIDFLKTQYATPTKEFLAKLNSIGEMKINDKTYWIDLFARGDFNRDKLISLLPEFDKYSNQEIDQILVESKYNRYIEKQQQQIDRMRGMLKVKIPQNFDYKKVSGLSNEIVEKLEKSTPPTLFGASQISGVTPASLDILYVYIKMAQKI